MCVALRNVLMRGDKELVWMALNRWRRHTVSVVAILHAQQWTLGS